MTAAEFGRQVHIAAEQLDQAAGICRVYWGSHGCDRPRGHRGRCRCDCCQCGRLRHLLLHRRRGCVARWPFYGRRTRFYGEDAAARGLRAHESPGTVRIDNWES